MKNPKSRLIVIVLLTLFAGWAVSDPSRFKLGPDLAGGTILVYQVNQDEARPQSLDMEKLLPALKERLDPAGLYNYVIRALGTDRVEIIMPEANTEEVDRIKRMITTVGELRFKIVGNRKHHEHLIERAELTWPNKVVGTEGVFIPYGIWIPAEKNKGADQQLVKDAEAAWPTKRVTPTAKFIPENELEVNVDPEIHVIKTDDANRRFVLVYWDDDGVGVSDARNLVRTDEDGDQYVLMYNDEYNVTGQYLTEVSPTLHDGDPAVAFKFDAEGAQKFYKLTGDFQPGDDGYKSQLGVILDNRLRSAPNLNARISNSGVITGNFTNEQVTELVSILDAGQLPFALKKTPTSEFQIAPTLGKDTIRNGIFSIVLALVTVIVFMLVYYGLTGGGLAVGALLLNLLFTVALMVMFKATWTLPGLAGLVLTVGMAVDANVLIFERMREELDRGASLGMAIRAGYDKAWSTILDSNVTSILTAIILFMIGTDQVKGFAVTLILGLLTSMFCAVWVTRGAIDFLYSRRWVKKLSMLRLLSVTNFDFLKPKKLCFTISAVLITVGLLGLWWRGWNNFDVDFTGGTMVGVEFNQKMDTAQVRQIAEGVFPNVSVEDVRMSGQEPGYQFVIRTTEQDPPPGPDGLPEGETVKEKMAHAFSGFLNLPKMTVGATEPVAAEAPSAPAPAPVAEAEAAKAKTTPTPADAMKAFAGGQQTTITFDKPRTPFYVRGQINDVIRASGATSANPEDLYALIPAGEPTLLTEEGASQEGFKEFKLATKQDMAALVKGLEGQLAASPDFQQYSQFGPQVASETQTRAIWAIALSWLGIIIYVWFRFGSWSFGIAGVAALVHDVLVAAGVMAIASILANYIPALEWLYITDMKINLNTVAALLTLIGFSINDTIVIFDRIREIKGKSPTISATLVNKALNETLSRTIITSLTVLFVVTILYFGGGSALRGFSFILVVGVLTGSYSTIYIASPILVWLSEYQENRKTGSTAKRDKVTV